ncbi:hypothetical protein AGMMS49521_1120 [Campylobacterota bacterium]|nr:hypothetical protein AGMMS49521_1120 [Campylobacterota bacterium]
MQIFQLIRNASRNATLRKYIPQNIQIFLWKRVLKAKGRQLRSELIAYYDNLEGGYRERERLLS